jgi:hypothetical protein
MKPRLATAWLGGCSGCHMSFLDLDERLIHLPSLVEICYSPLMDIKEFPERVDIALVEGAVANEDDLRSLWRIRSTRARWCHSATAPWLETSRRCAMSFRWPTYSGVRTAKLRRASHQTET